MQIDKATRAVLGRRRITQETFSDAAVPYSRKPVYIQCQALIHHIAHLKAQYERATPETKAKKLSRLIDAYARLEILARRDYLRIAEARAAEATKV